MVFGIIEGGSNGIKRERVKGGKERKMGGGDPPLKP